MLALQPAPRDFLKAVRSRSRSFGITTADVYLREFEECLDGKCPSHALTGVTEAGWARAMKRAKSIAVYQGPGIAREETFRVKEATLPKGLVLPPKTIAWTEVIVTTPTRDRDGDILDTEGASLFPKASHLFNHLPVENIGRLLKETRHTAKVLQALLSLHATKFAENVAVMYEHGSLETSHGFLPKKWEPLDDGEGFLVLEFDILEISGVSIPSNPDAGPIEFSRNKLTHPLLKEWGRMKFRKRRKQAAVTIDVAALPVESAAPCECKAHPVSKPNELAVTAEKESDPLRWNPSLSKHFDVSEQPLEPASMIYDWASKFLEVPVKKIFFTTTFVPSARMGSFLSAWQQETAGYELEGVRNVGHGTERPPVYSVVQLNSTKSADFLVEGTAFYRGGQDFIARFEPNWRGLEVDLYFAYDDRKSAAELIDKTWQTAKEQFCFLKGECFALSGDFLPRTSETWDDLFLTPKNKQCLERTVKALNEKQEKFANRGVVLLGPPGTGKTLGGRIIRNQSKATFIWLSSRDFHYSGAFGSLTYAFDLAKELAPSIIFIEDVDNWMGDTTIDLLKTEMDGIGRSAGILTILTTNYPERFPDALIDRPGRFHDVLKLDLPDKTARAQMLAKWVGDIPAETRKTILEVTDGWSGAHMYELAQFAKVLQEQDDLELPDSLTKAIDKITEQRELITEALLGGSHFRPRKELSDLKAKPTVRHKVLMTATQTKGALPYHESPVSDSDTWDADVAVKGVRKWAGVDEDEPTAVAWAKYGEAFALLDGPKDNLTSYKLPYKQVEDGKLVINKRGVSAGIAALNGARGKGMDISEADKKAAYDVLAKAYKKAYPDEDVPELKSVEPIDKGLYLDLEGSWDNIRDQLAETIKAYLISAACAGPADWVYIAAMFPDHALVAVLEDAMMPGDACVLFDDANTTYFEVQWKLVDGAAVWDGDVAEVDVSVDVSETTERAFTVQSKAFMKTEHLKKLSKAMGHLDAVMEHEDTTPQVNALAKRAMAHVKAVHDAHSPEEKGVFTEKHGERLEKAMGYCSQGMEHEKATPELKKLFKSAHKLIKGVKDAMDGDMGEASTVPPGTKENRKFSAENEKHLKGAFHHLKAAAMHSEATAATTELAEKAASKVGSLFATGGDDGSDYDEDGNYTGTDMNAYTAPGESGDGKAGAAVSKESKTTIHEAKTLTKQLARHTEATRAVKALAKGAYEHLKAVVPTDASEAQDDDDGDMSYHDGNPTGTTAPEKSLGERLNDAADEAEFAHAERDEEKCFDLIESAGALSRIVDVVRDLRAATAKP